MNDESKTLFFGVEVHCPWPEKLPRGRHLAETDRHLTLAFLGNTRYQPLGNLLPDIPQLEMPIGLVGQFDSCLFLPIRKPRVVAWNVHWLENYTPLLSFRAALIEWLQKNDFKVHVHPGEFLAHVTIARGQFNPKQWMKDFEPLPMFVKDLHLYESLGYSKYQPIWSQSLLSPFEKIQHTRDITYLVRGLNLKQVTRHAEIAIAFHCPTILQFLHPIQEIKDLNDANIHLNELITRADQEIGCPIKAVSFHSEIKETESYILEWEWRDKSRVLY